MVDVIFGIFCVVDKKDESHKLCETSLIASKSSHFSSSFRYRPWADNFWADLIFHEIRGPNLRTGPYNLGPIFHEKKDLSKNSRKNET